MSAVIDMYRVSADLIKAAMQAGDIDAIRRSGCSVGRVIIPVAGVAQMRPWVADTALSPLFSLPIGNVYFPFENIGVLAASVPKKGPDSALELIVALEESMQQALLHKEGLWIGITWTRQVI